jgi:hypothetical protein
MRADILLRYSCYITLDHRNQKIGFVDPSLRVEPRAAPSYVAELSGANNDSIKFAEFVEPSAG